jgi:hypothetical protein
MIIPNYHCFKVKLQNPRAAIGGPAAKMCFICTPRFNQKRCCIMHESPVRRAAPQHPEVDVNGSNGPVATPAPPAWFLPGPIRIRGGLARHFASAWLFHRGSHLGQRPKIKYLNYNVLNAQNRLSRWILEWFSQESTQAKIEPV